MVETIRPVVESMSALGYGDRLYAYGFDESLSGQRHCDMAPSVRAVFGAVKRAFPNLTTMTAGAKSVDQPEVSRNAIQTLIFGRKLKLAPL